jgi:hypothetical protein
MGSVGDCRDEHTTFGANHEIRGPMRETIVPNPGGILDVDGETTRRVRCANHAMAPAKRTAVVPQAPVHGIDVGAIDDSETATMASALIFPHLSFLAIDCTLAHWDLHNSKPRNPQSINFARPLLSAPRPWRR